LNVQKDEPDAAITSMTQLIKRRPQLAMPYLILAGAYAQKGDFANAIVACPPARSPAPRKSPGSFLSSAASCSSKKKGRKPARSSSKH